MVLMDLKGDEGIYNHSQATMVLNEFFEAYPKGEFEYSFQGKKFRRGNFFICILQRFISKIYCFNVIF
jgi:hypothetical protein